MFLNTRTYRGDTREYRKDERGFRAGGAFACVTCLPSTVQRTDELTV